MASTIDLETLLASLPACKRCRRNRRRCDTKLPSCANCSKAGVECIFYDHALQEELPRSYIASLVEHLTREENTVAPIDTSAAAVVPPVLTAENAQAGHHFAYAQGAYRYLGAGSHLLDIRDDGAKSSRSHLQLSRPALPLPSYAVVDPIPGDLRIYLTRLFFETIHKVYPFLDPLSSALLSESASSSPSSRPPSATQEFVQEMIWAVACHCERSDDDTSTTSIVERKQRLHALGAAAHARALRRIEQATAAQAVSTLQVVVLLVLYTLLCPATGGNISQQLGFAIRLVIDLCESGSDNEGEDDAAGERPPPLSSLYKVIYCLENYVCGVLVRPTALPEPVEPLMIPSFSVFLSSSTPSPDDSCTLNLLCTLYRVQARCRNGGRIDADETHSELHSAVLAFADDHQKHKVHEKQQNGEAPVQTLHPNVAAVLGETCLLLDPTSTGASVALLDAYTDPGYLATFLSPYWVHRVATVVLDALLDGKGSSQQRLVRAYGQAVALLTSWASTWDAAGVLRQALEQRLEEG